MKWRRAKAAGETDPARNRSDLITPSNAKRAIAVGKVLAPVLLPFAMRAAGAARGAWDDRRARRLGVAPGKLTSYSARAARCTPGSTASPARWRNSRRPRPRRRAAAVNRFVGDAEPRLIDLAAAVRAAELMPTERRKAAHRAVGAELDRLEPELLKLLA